MNVRSRRVLIGLLLLTPIVGFLPTQVAALATYTENFDDDTVGLTPSASWYTHTVEGSVGSVVLSSAPTIGSKSWKVTTSTAAASFASLSGTAAVDLDVCNTFAVISFAFNIDVLPAVGNILYLAITDDSTFATADRIGLRIESDGVPDAMAAQTSGATFATFAGTLVVDTWYNATISNIGCGTRTATVSILELGEAVSVDCSSVCSDTFVNLENFKAGGTTAGGARSMFVDLVSLQNVQDPPAATLSAAESIAVVNLSGFDVNPLGTTVIARTSGDFIRTYEAQSLTAATVSYDGDCNRADGVMSSYQGDLVAFIKCDGTADPTDLFIRTSALGVPTSDDLDGCDFCDNEISLSGFSSAGGDGAGEIGQIESFPIDYSNFDNPGFGVDRREVMWAFTALGGTAQEGKVGVNLFRAINNLPDERYTKEVQFTNLDGTDDICVGRVGEQYYLAAVEDTSSTKIYPLSIVGSDGHSTNFGAGSTPFGTASIVSGANGGLGIGCAGEKLIVQTASTTAVVDRSGVMDWSRGIVATVSRGVAISDAFTIGSAPTTYRYVAYKDGANVKVADAANGDELAQFPIAAGTFKGVAMDRTAQSVWVFTTDFIERFDVHVQTTIVSVPTQGGSAPGGDGDGTGGVIGDTVVTSLTPVFGGFGAQLVGGVLVIGMFAYGLWEEGSRQKIWAIVGSILGFILAWAFGFLSTGAVFAIIMISGLIFYAYKRFGA